MSADSFPSGGKRLLLLLLAMPVEIAGGTTDAAVTMPLLAAATGVPLPTELGVLPPDRSFTGGVRATAGDGVRCGCGDILRSSAAFSLTVGDGAVDAELVVEPDGFGVPWPASFAALGTGGADPLFALPRCGVPRADALLPLSSALSLVSSPLLLGVTTDSGVFPLDRLGVLADMDTDDLSSIGLTAPGRPMPVITDADTLFFGVLAFERPEPELVGFSFSTAFALSVDDGASSSPTSCSVGSSSCTAAPSESRSSTS